MIFLKRGGNTFFLVLLAVFCYLPYLRRDNNSPFLGTVRRFRRKYWYGQSFSSDVSYMNGDDGYLNGSLHCDIAMHDLQPVRGIGNAKLSCLRMGDQCQGFVFYKGWGYLKSSAPRVSCSGNAKGKILFTKRTDESLYDQNKHFAKLTNLNVLSNPLKQVKGSRRYVKSKCLEIPLCEGFLYMGPNKGVLLNAINSNDIEYVRHKTSSDLYLATNKFLLQRPSTNTILTFQMRSDRMGSKSQLVLGIWALANYYNVSWCTQRDEFVDVFDFQVCDADKYTPFNMFAIQSHQAGLYLLPGGNDNIARSKYAPWSILSNVERTFPSTVWTDNMVWQWGEKITNAALQNVRLKRWEPMKDLYVAVHVRRGDIVNNSAYSHAWISDKKINFAISQTIEFCSRFNRGIKVHLFSEETKNYDWSNFHHVDEFHLTSLHNDLNTNLRDWYYFIHADILIVGGTFSAVPALGRMRPNENGLPLTLYWKDSYGYFDRRKFVPPYWIGISQLLKKAKANDTR